MMGEVEHKGGLYGELGLALLIAGAGLMIVALLLLRSVPLTALGTSGLILSLICFGLERSVPRVSPAMAQLLMAAAQENIAAVAEEIGLSDRALYLPSSVTGGQARALVPAVSVSAMATAPRQLPNRLLVPWGSHQENIGLLVTTLGSRTIPLLAGRVGDTPEEMESALTQILVGELDAVGSVLVSTSSDGLSVELSRVRVQLPAFACDQLLGSPLASVVASVVAEALSVPVIIAREEHRGDRLLVELETR